MKEKKKFYTTDEILKYDADYNVIYGERSNGKTTSVLRYGLKRHVESGYVEQTAIVRRWEIDFKGMKGQQMCENLVNLGWVKDLTKGKYNSILYYSQRWYLCLYSETGEKLAQCNEPFAFGFSLASEEHYKSASFPNITTILFDEFITRDYYLNEEFIKFQNLLSTIIRLRTNVKIFMCGNTINKFCPYFNEMGLTGIKKQKRGTIDIYSYGDTTLKVAVEYSDFPTKKKASNKYFAFNNPKLEMITQGGWELSIYPHLPVKYKPKECVYIFYIVFDTDILQGNIIHKDNEVFMYIHRKTTPIQEDNKRIVYDFNVNYKRNYRQNFLKPYEKADMKLFSIYKTGKVFYQDNEVGEIFSNYIKECTKKALI